ncbi:MULTISPECIES: Hsp33 family molecular chaperone HslO [unclassified Meiothermus]|uniref:Hsp33 family molecular chaperone HslO n=1 Tax=unclassified Meiothermus TaxID=370471 RepID=UPI000D7BD4B5|nr:MULTISPECIES: Hsp33 family molecular chaperone HslO [unclassified Meiothermus]PZA07868.1 Hsp33 family molecular chaperone HslO [Meiothermus sp. Pnk-1]RYM38827.1 Hsp33 family molecular chaperone HslO [Meiothermus sp. PNK-Is4]
MGRLIHGLAAAGSLRVLAADTTDITEEARQRHGLSATATAALGRAMTGGLLLAFLLSKTPRERVDLRFDGDGPLGGLIVDAGPDGTVRAYAKNPRAELPLRRDGKLNVGALVGKGQLRVSRALSNGEIYDSATELVSGEIAEDLAHYLWQSEQVPSAVLLGVRVHGDGRVQVAGGVIVQVMPEASQAVIDALEANLRRLGGITPLLAEHGMERTVEILLKGLDYTRTDLRALGFEGNYIPLQFRCTCSQQKAREALIFFDRGEREEMITKDGGAEAVCHWCNQRYWITPEEIRSLAEPSTGGEVRCPDCGTLWYFQTAAGLEVHHDGETCTCGRRVRRDEGPRA